MKNSNLLPNLEFKINGKNFQNLLNLFTYKNIDIKKCYFLDKNTIKFQTNKINERKIIDLLKNSCYNFSVEEVRHTKSLMTSLMKNVGLIFSIIIFIISSFIYPNYIWNIKIYGDDICIEKVNQFLQSSDVKIGTQKSKIDISKLEQNLINYDNTLSQVDIAINGGTLLINTNKKIISEELYSNFNPIVSQYDGEIVSISVLSGTLNANVGQIVKKGDILVQPYVVDEQGNKKICIAKAEIEIMAYFEASLNYDENGQSLKRTGKRFNTSNLNILGLSFGKMKDCSFKQYEIEEKEIQISNILPIKKKNLIYYELDYIENTVPFDEVKELLISQCEEKINKRYFNLEEATRIENITILKEGYYNILITYKVLVRQ